MSARRLAPPTDHGGLSAEPPLGDWVTALQANLTGPSRIKRFGLDPAGVRRETGFGPGTLVMSGHQPVLFHPGLWAKPLAASALAQAVGGRAAHKITDQDEPGEGEGWVPERTETGLRPLSLRLSQPGVPYAFQKPPELGAWESALQSAADSGQAAVQTGMAAFGTDLEGGPTSASDWDGWHQGSLQALDKICGTERDYLRASRVWAGKSFRSFLSIWLSDPGKFGGAMNRALARYRKDRGIQHSLTPVPDLAAAEGWFETPFWTAAVGSPRRPLWVQPGVGRVRLRSGEGSVWEWALGTGGEGLADSPWALWPKALPQSLFSRLFLCDFFVHGLGGGDYEPVNDFFLQELGEPPGPAFGVVSATMFFDPEAAARSKSILGKSARVAFWNRAFEKNPEYLLTRPGEWGQELPQGLLKSCREAAQDPLLAGPAKEKAELLPRMADSTLRGDAGKRISELNRVLTGRLEGLRASFEAFGAGLEGLQRTREALAFREYAYFCYPPERWLELKRDIDQALGARK